MEYVSNTKINEGLSKEKLKSKLRMSFSKEVWENSMNNFKSNRIKNTFLLFICLNEVGTMISINCSIAYFVPQIISRTGSVQDTLNAFKFTYGFTNGIHIFIHLEENNVFRVFNAISIISTYCATLSIRVLTQYMVDKYSFYKPHISLRTELTMPLLILLPLFIMGTVSLLIKIFYIILLFASKKLCLLLKQRLTDATLHENQPEYVKLYYRLAYREYKCSSRIFLFAYMLEILGLFLYCIQPVVMATIGIDFKYQNANKIYKNVIYNYDLIVNSIELVLLTLAASIQIILYSIVSLRRLARNIYNRIRKNTNISASYPLIRKMIGRNQSAYMMNN